MGSIVKCVINLLRLYVMGNPFLMMETSSFKNFIIIIIIIIIIIFVYVESLLLHMDFL